MAGLRTRAELRGDAWVLNGSNDPARLADQLEVATTALVNGDVEIDARAGTVTLSRLFYWYEEDFGDVIAFVLRYVDADPDRDWLDAHRATARLVHRPYSRALNAARPAR